MKLPQNSLLKRINIDYRVLAFLLPFLGMVITMICRQTAPFGSKYSMLYSDMYHQYYPFFFSFRNALRNGESLLYSWKVGMGMDYLGLIAYYLASPLNLLSIFIPFDSWVLGYFSMLMPIKLGLAGLFFAIFLSRTFQKNDLSVAVFSSCYALCAWALGYHWNIMWLDTFALLPLVMLGMLALLQERKFVLYTVSLFLSVFANYYIGFFTCIFTLLAFICYQICKCKSIKRLMTDLLLMALFSALAIGMTSILTLPAYSALQTTQSSVNSYPETFALNIVDSDLTLKVNAALEAAKEAKAAGNNGSAFSHNWDAFRYGFIAIVTGMGQAAGNMNGALVPTFKEGLPNLYCGVGAIFLAFLFLTCRQIKLRDKLCSVFLLLFFLLSFLSRKLDYIWHGFHFPNMIPYRFSFLFSFVLLVMAYRAYLLRHRFRWWQVAAGGVLSVGIMLLAGDPADPAYWIYNAVFLLLYLTAAVLLVLRKAPAERKDRKTYLDELYFRRRMAGWLFIGIMMLEMALNLVNFSTAFPSTGISNYPMETDHAASVIRYMKQREDDNLFYRAEVTRSQTLNDGALNDYNGISTFTSSANVKVTNFMKALGYGAKDTYNRYRFEESSPVSNLFLNLKYMIDRDNYVAPNSYFDVKNKFGNVALLENNAYLPLGFLAESELAEVDFSSSTSPLMFQNDLLKAASGTKQDAWRLINGSKLSIEGSEGVEMTRTTTTGYCKYEASEKGQVVYTYNVNQSGFMCISLHIYPQNKYNIVVNDVVQETHSSEGTYGRAFSLPLTVAVGDVKPGDVVQLRFYCNAGESGSAQIYAGVLNETVFREAYDKLAASTLELTAFEDTYIEGTIHCNRDGLMYTSIPQDGNWVAIVDGKPAEIVLVGDAMIGIPLTQGEHTVSFTYRNEAFSLGWKISLGCLALFLGLYWYFYRKKK